MLFRSLTTKVFSGSTSGIIYTYTDLSNEYIDIRATINCGNNTSLTYIVYLTNNGVTSYQGDGTSGVYIAFAQLEQQSSATSLMMPITEGSTQQRNSDVVSQTVISGVSTVTLNDGTPSAVTPATTYTIPNGRYTKITMQ